MCALLKGFTSVIQEVYNKECDLILRLTIIRNPGILVDISMLEVSCYKFSEGYEICMSNISV